LQATAELGIPKTDPSVRRYPIVSNNFPPVSNTREWGLSTQAEVSLGAVTWSTIASYRDFKSYREQDNDFVNVDLTRLDFEDTHDRFFTLKTTLKGIVGRLDRLAGGFYFDQNTNQSSAVTFGASLAPYFQRVFPAQAVLMGPLYPVGAGATTRRLSQALKGYSFFTHKYHRGVTGREGDGRRALAAREQGRFRHLCFDQCPGLRARRRARKPGPRLAAPSPTMGAYPLRIRD